MVTALSETPGVDLVVAGCDGACFNAPQIVITSPSGQKTRLVRVTPEDAEHLAEGLPKVPDSNSIDSEEFFAAQTRLVLDGCGEDDATDIEQYVAKGGYEALYRALATSPQGVTEAVEEAGLLGRGGAYFPAARKWQSARGVSRTPRFLVVNSEEGEPGVFKDRHIMEGVPHRLVEGLIIAAFAAEVEVAYVYINAEANLSAQRVERALQQASEYGLLGEDILGSGFNLRVEVRRGAGGYVCGEETTLLNTIEGERRVPRLRPPFPTESGLWAGPTVINNTEDPGQRAGSPC